MELLVTLLIGVPFAIAAVLAIVKNDWLRGKIVYLGGLLIAILAVVTAAMWYTGKETVTFNLPGTEALSWIVLAGDFFLMFLVIWLSIKHHKTIICVLTGWHS